MVCGNMLPPCRQWRPVTHRGRVIDVERHQCGTVAAAAAEVGRQVSPVQKLGHQRRSEEPYRGQYGTQAHPREPDLTDIAGIARAKWIPRCL
jgi:hypothetical protein